MTRLKTRRPAVPPTNDRPVGEKAWRPWGGLALAILVGAAAYAYVFDAKLYLGGDNAAYYLLGKALAGGDGFTSIWKATNPPHSHFPPGYPAIIAVAMTLGLASTTAIKLVNGALLLGSVALLFPVVRRMTGSAAFAGVACAFVALNAHVLYYGTIMMSEVPFLFLTTLALYGATRVDLERAPWRDGWFWATLAALVASVYVRSIGVAAVFGLVAYFAWQRRWWHAALAGALSVAAVIPWQLRSAALGGGGHVKPLLMVNPYQPDLGQATLADLGARVLANLGRYVTAELPTVLLPIVERSVGGRAALTGALGIVLVAAVLAGVWRLRRLRTLVAAYLVGTFGILLLWPDVWTGIRFVLGVAPLLTALALWGLLGGASAAAARFGRARPVSPLWLLPLLLLAWPPIQALHEQAARPYPPDWANYFRLAEWARENTPEDAVISVRKEEMFYLFAERPTTRFRYTTDTQAVLDGLDEAGTDYVVFASLGFGQPTAYLGPAIQSRPDRFPLVARLPNPETYVFQMLPDTARAARPGAPEVP